MTAPLAISIDRDRCMGSGTCVFYAPEVFVIDSESGIARVINVSGNPLDDVLDAADACPTQAISIDAQAPAG